MPLYTTDALILRTYRLAESDRIVVFLTRDRGKKRGVAKGAQRSRRRFGGALEPLTRASVAYFENERRELVRLDYVALQRSPLATSDPDALGHASYFAELIDEWAQDADPNEKLYRLGASTVEALSLGTPVQPLARYFEYWLLRLQGVYPSITGCSRCGRDLARGGRLGSTNHGFLCTACTDRGPALSATALAFLRGAAGTAPDRLNRVELSRQADRELEVVHRLLIAAHLEKELKSVRVLREMRH